MALVSCSKKYTRLSDAKLSDLLATVIQGLTNHTDIYKTPEIPVATLNDLKTEFDSLISKAANRGRMEIAARDAKREQVIAALDTEATYVDLACKGDLTNLLASGFTPINTNRTRKALEQVQVKEVRNPRSGELQAVVKAQTTAKAYVGRIAPKGSEFGPSLTFASSREIIFKGLTAGVKYVVQVCAVGGLNGLSDWSDPVEHMAM